VCVCVCVCVCHDFGAVPVLVFFLRFEYGVAVRACCFRSANWVRLFALCMALVCSALCVSFNHVLHCASHSTLFLFFFSYQPFAHSFPLF
jgi:hypothetical protein